MNEKKKESYKIPSKDQISEKEDEIWNLYGKKTKLVLRIFGVLFILGTIVVLIGLIFFPEFRQSDQVDIILLLFIISLGLSFLFHDRKLFKV